LAVANFQTFQGPLRFPKKIQGLFCISKFKAVIND